MSIDPSALAFLPPELKLKILASLDASSATTDDSTSAPTDADDEQPQGEPPQVFEQLPSAEDVPASHVLSADEIATLASRGYVVKDAFLSASELAEVRAEVEAWRDEGKLQQAGMKAAASQELWTAEKRRGDFITWLHEDECTPAVGHALRKVYALQTELNSVAGFDSHKHQTQLAFYPGKGARYVRHRDAYPGGPTRRLTCLLYLNPDWKEGDGGQLRVYAKERVDLEPLGGRVVIFLSSWLEHEVLPAHADRFALTAWFY